MASCSQTQVTQLSGGESSTDNSAVGKDFKANLWAMADKVAEKGVNSDERISVVIATFRQPKHLLIRALKIKSIRPRLFG